MPKLPRIGPGEVVPLRAVRPEDVGSGVGQAAYAGAAQDLGAISARLIGAEREAQVATAEVGYTAKLAEFAQTVDQNPDTDAREAQFEEGRKAIAEEFRGTLRGQQYQADFDQRAFQHGERAKLAVREGVIKKRLDNARGGVIEAADKFATLADQAKTDQERAGYVFAANNILDAGESGGALSAAETANHRVQFEARLQQAGERRAMAGVKEQIRANPAQAYLDLQDPTKYVELDAYQRQVGMDQAVTEHQQGLASDRAAVSHAQSQRDRQDKAIAAEAQKLADEALAAGDMDRLDQILAQSRDVMTPEDRRYYLKRKAAGGGLEDATAHTDDATYVSLFNEAAGGLPIRERADAEVHAGRLTIAHRDSLVKQSAEKRFGGAEKYLSDKLAVGSAVESMTGRTLAADAQRTMLDWRNRNPEATEEDAMAKAVEIGSRYSLLNLNETEAAMATPKFAVGDRTNGFDLDATEDAITDHYVQRHGLIGQPQDVVESTLKADQEYQQELVLLNRWRVTQGRRLENQPKPGAQRVK